MPIQFGPQESGTFVDDVAPTEGHMSRSSKALRARLLPCRKLRTTGAVLIS